MILTPTNAIIVNYVIPPAPIGELGPTAYTDSRRR